MKTELSVVIYLHLHIHYFPLQAEKRAHHNALERKRRDHIKDSFSSLRDSVPALQGEKVNNSTKVITISIFTPGSYDHLSTVLEMKIWIYFSELNFLIYFYIPVFLIKNRKIYWSWAREQVLIVRTVSTVFINTFVCKENVSYFPE